MAEKEGFEPSMSFQPIHEFQSCAINRARRLLHGSDLTVRIQRTTILYAIFLELSSGFSQIYSFLLPESAKMDFGGIFLILRLTNLNSGVSLDSELLFETKVSLSEDSAEVLPKKPIGKAKITNKVAP